MARVLELKHTMVALENSDFQYLDEILADLKLTPNDMALPVPPYFRRDNMKARKEREKLLDTLNAQRTDDYLNETRAEVELTLDEAIAILQRNERARQGRLRAKFMLDIRAQEERERQRRDNPPPVISKHEAATVIQAHVRGMFARFVHGHTPPTATFQILSPSNPPPSLPKGER